MNICKLFAAGLIFSITFSTSQPSRAQWMEKQSDHNFSSYQEQLRAFDESLRVLEKANPMVDLRAALRRGDKRFVGYYGLTSIIPGVSWKYLKKTKPRGLKILRGSSDVITTDLSNRLVRVRRTYMEPYNKALLQVLLSQQHSRRKRKK